MARPRLAAQIPGASIKHFNFVARNSHPIIWNTTGLSIIHQSGNGRIPAIMAYMIMPAGTITSIQ